MNKYILLVSLFLMSLEIGAQCVDNGNYWNDSWVSCIKSTNPNPLRGESHWLLYEFHETQFVDSTHIWNANRSGESGFGAKDVVIDYSEDGNTWIELGEYNFPQADESQDYSGFVGPDFDGKEVQKILITVLSTFEAGNCASIAEILIGIDDDACFGIIDECGVCDGPGATTWYIDADNDGLGDPNTSVTDCNQPSGYVEDNSDLCDNGALGWADIGVLFENNGCNNCHNQNAAGGLDLRSYESTVMGGNVCGQNLLTSDHFVKVIVTSEYDGCGTIIGSPSMNDRSSGEFDQSELDKLQNWINGGFSELCTDFTFGVDVDGDGFFSDVDCNDNNADVNPGAAEIPNNGIDEDCDGLDSTTSTHELSISSVRIYPNPTKGVINIEFSNPLNFEIMLFDINGKLILTSQNVKSIDVLNLASGLYLLKLKDLESGSIVTDRIIVGK